MEDADFRGDILMDLRSPCHWCFEPVCNISNILSEHFKNNMLQLNYMPCMEKTWSNAIF